MFIVLEGVDGCGKSTHAKLLAKGLTESGLDVVLTCEPTDGPIGTLIRRVLGGKLEMDASALALLFTADRAQHQKQINEALKHGNWVICERYVHSTVAYQAAQGLERAWLLELNKFARPADLVYLLDIDPKSAEERTFTGEIFEKESFLRKVREQYMLFDDLIIIKTDRSKEDVAKDILDCALKGSHR